MHLNIRRKIRKQIDNTIDRMESIPPSFLFEEAETYVCSVCEMKHKPCMRYTGIVCRTMISSGTVLELLQSTDRSEQSGTSQTCIRCGGEIETGTLLRNPLTEICPHCRRQEKRTRIT